MLVFYPIMKLNSSHYTVLPASMCTITRDQRNQLQKYA